MTAADHIRQQMKSWTAQELEAFAAKLLIVNQTNFHGSKTIHYASGVARKVEDKIVRDIC